MRLGQKWFNQTIGPKSLVKKKPKPAPWYHDERQNAPQLAHEQHKQCLETKLCPNHVPLPVFFYYAIFFLNLPARPCPPFENSARQVPVYLYDHPVRLLEHASAAKPSRPPIWTHLSPLRSRPIQSQPSHRVFWTPKWWSTSLLFIGTFPPHHRAPLAPIFEF